jgi:lysozyme family protein
MVDMAELRAVNAQRWTAAKTTRNFISVAKSLVSPAAKAKYHLVEQYTGVPWYIIAVIHERESSQNWNGNLGQGDPWDKVSIHVPKGRGPFHSWEAAAFDALVNCSPYAAKNHDWSPGGALTLLEEYNGLGYASRGLPSPYVWSGTNQYKSGKYIADGLFKADAVDTQLGCAGLLLAMMALDRTIKFGGVSIPVSNPSPPPPDVVASKPPPPPRPAVGGISGFIAAILKVIWR